VAQLERRRLRAHRAGHRRAAPVTLDGLLDVYSGHGEGHCQQNHQDAGRGRDRARVRLARADSTRLRMMCRRVPARPTSSKPVFTTRFPAQSSSDSGCQALGRASRIGSPGATSHRDDPAGKVSAESGLVSAEGLSRCGRHYPRQESDTSDAGRRGWLAHRFVTSIPDCILAWARELLALAIVRW